MRERGRIRFFQGLTRAGLSRRVFFLLLLGICLAVGAFAIVNASTWVGKPFPGFLVARRMTISGVGLYHWTGSRAGLLSYDKIQEADGHALATRQDLDAVVAGKRIGDPVLYTVRRGDREFQVAIGTMRFLLSDLLLIFGSYLLTGLAYLATGAIVFLLKPDTRVSWSSFLITLSMGLYYFTTFDTMSTDAGLLRIYILVTGFSPFAVMYFSLLFPERTRFIDRYPRLQYLPFLASAVYIALMEYTYPGPASVVLWRLGPAFTAAAIIMFLIAILHALFKGGSEVSKQRSKVVLLGASLAFPVPSYFMILGSTIGGAVGKYPVLNNLLVFPYLIFPVSIAYAIAKHNLFDVDVYIKRTVGYAIMTVVVGAGYLTLQIAVKSVLLGPILGDAAEKAYTVIFALLVVFLFNPLNRVVQGGVDRIFYRRKYDYRATVSSVSEALSSVLRLDEIIRKIVHTVHDEMFIERSGLLVAGATGGTWEGHVTGGPASGPGQSLNKVTLPPDDPLVAVIRERKALLTKYDVEEDPRFAGVRETCGRRFDELGALMAVPLVYQDEVKAVLAVGHKKSGHFFNREDVDLLQTLASHGAVAIENAHMAEQMKKEETVRTNLSRYLSPQIVERIVRNDVQVNLGGDRKVVTVLFSDIRNFTTITESRPPDQLVHILNEYFTEMAQVIFEHQGSLDKYIGDAIVAVFGSLIPLENPARNAVAAAVAMMRRLPELNRRWGARYDFYMSIGIGVNTGEVFLGNIGSPERMEFTVIGDAVNVASRFSGLAKPSQVLVTKETLSHLGSDFPVREHPPSEVKGKTGKLEVFEIIYTQSVI